MNKQMKQILMKGHEKENTSGIEDIVKEIVDKTKLIKDCLIFDESGNLNEKKIDFEKVLKINGDLTGYEVNCNELRFTQEKIPSEQFLNFIEIFQAKLLDKFNEKKIGIVISVSDDFVDLRFHIYRKKEGLWLDEDLNNYDNPILYCITL